MKRYLKEMIVLGVIVAFVGLWLITGFGTGNKTYLKKLSKEVGVNMIWGDMVSEGDSHGGFHGDGTKILVLHYTDSSMEPEFEENEKWSAFPLPQELETVIYGKTEGNYTSGPYIAYESVGIEIPEITNGYYYFKDRFSETSNPYDYSEVLGRGAFNFTLLLYDCDTDLLYICEVDT